MRVLDFKVLIEPEPEGGFVVTCPFFQGCYSQGDTLEEAMANIREAIELCLEEVEQRGEEIPDPSLAMLGSVIVEA